VAGDREKRGKVIEERERSKMGRFLSSPIFFCGRAVAIMKEEKKGGEKGTC